MARRQEQESARTEVTEVAPSVLRMELPIHMPGLGHVNCYALVDSRGVALVDPGLPGPLTWRAIQDRLRQADLEVRHVHTVVVTHSHPDHFGGAARLARESGAEIVAHRSFSFGPVRTEPDAEVSVEDLAAQAESDAAREEVESKAPPLPPAPAGRTPWGGERPRPPWRMRMRLRLMRLVGRSFLPKITRPVDHGDVLELGGREWFVLHTPGHTQDHFCLHDPDSGILLAGDHVLPTITPHISGFNSTPDPLKSYFYSLDRVGEIAGVKQALPAHGHPFTELRARTEAIKRHHLERLEKVKEISRELGPATVGAISRRLFAQRSWGAMAESETYAHLEHLRHAGEAECHRAESGKLVYVA